MIKRQKLVLILFLALFLFGKQSGGQALLPLQFDFYGNPVSLETDSSIILPFPATVSAAAIQQFSDLVPVPVIKKITARLLELKAAFKLDDWLYYQLIRKTAQQISPKADNYYRYTMYKWLLLTNSGYDAILTLYEDKLLFYVLSPETIYNIPARVRNGKQYICLNYHDYGFIDFGQSSFKEVSSPVSEAVKSFSYKVSNVPLFRPGAYLEKDIRFSYRHNDYYFRIILNPDVKTVFQNYPVVDYDLQFSVPLSSETYQSLIPALKKIIRKKPVKKGVDFLMRFTREAFVFEADSAATGSEKRLTAEQTLLYDQSDCEDRAALFFYLVKEIYNLPMIVLVYPRHVTVAVRFSKPAGTKIIYNGDVYTVCEPTPQYKDLRIGQLPPGLKDQRYEVAFAYNPSR